MKKTAILDTMGRKKSGGRSRDLGTVIPYSVEIPKHIMDAMEKYKVVRGPSKKWIILKGLVAFLEKEGFLESEEIKDIS